MSPSGIRYDLLRCDQCCGSVVFWHGSGSGSAVLYLWLTDPAPDPAISSLTFQDGNKKLCFFQSFFRYYFLNLHLHNYSKIKSHEEVKKQWESRFSYYFCLMIEGSGTVTGSGSLPCTDGSGYRRSKDIRIRIRNRNTGCDSSWMPNDLYACPDAGRSGSRYFWDLKIIIFAVGQTV